MEVTVSPNKTLYIRDVDVPIWERAEKAAERARQPISQLVTGLLRHHVEQLATADDEITVDMRDPHGHEWTEAFRGRWLIEPDDENCCWPEEDAGLRYGIAQTARGKIAIYIYHINGKGIPDLTVYEDLDDMQEDFHLAPEVIAAAASVMGQRRVIHRDI
jgi:hypothetical protein